MKKETKRKEKKKKRKGNKTGTLYQTWWIIRLLSCLDCSYDFCKLYAFCLLVDFLAFQIHLSKHSVNPALVILQCCNLYNVTGSSVLLVFLCGAFIVLYKWSIRKMTSLRGCLSCLVLEIVELAKTWLSHCNSFAS